MIYGNRSISALSRSNTFIWWIMAFQAGLINIGGLMASHRFVSHITGFASYFGLHMTKDTEFRSWSLLLIPLFFLIGGMISGQLVDLRLKLGKRPKYYLSFGLIFSLTLCVWIAGIEGVFGPFAGPVEKVENYFLVSLLCLICGIQNGTIATVSRSVVRTTHLTGITTDLGIGIIRMLNKDQLKGKIPHEGSLNLIRIGIILCFFAGSALGALAFKQWQFGGFIFPVIISGGLFGLMMYFQVLKPSAEEK